MTNQELYKQAILDAKAVRETAMAAAKESLAEAFEPRIKEMLRLKLSEELEETEMEEAKDMEESTDMEETKKMEEAEEMEESDNMEESTLDEILAELDALSEADDDTMEEAKKDKMDKMEEAKDDEAEEKATDDDAEEPAADDAMAGAGDEEPTDDEQVVELTVGELKDIFRDVFMQAQGGAAPEMDGTLDEPADQPTELSLEEILAELEEEETKMEEAAFVPGDAKAVAKGKVGETAEKIEEKKKADKMAKDLEEAKKAINAMRGELQEVNLLNAKLLYVNKIWKGKSLSEAQKVKVLNAFDRATTVKEAENIFKTLNESMEAPKKANLKESLGFASKPIGSAPAKPIVEADSMVARWQKIAGIN